MVSRSTNKQPQAPLELNFRVLLGWQPKRKSMRVFRTSLSYQNPLRHRFNEEFFRNLPKVPGIYFMKDGAGEILYIGKAKCLRSRLTSYRTAKPGHVGENIIECLERVEKIDFEKHATEQDAFERERDLIRAFVPPYNIADAWKEDYLFIGLRGAGDRIEFRLTSREGDRKDFELHGCFTRRGRVKTAYSSLLRLLWAVTTTQDRFSFPARLTRSSPSYHYALKVADAGKWQKKLSEFLSGQGTGLLEWIVLGLLENERIPAFVRPGLQEDLEILAAFQRTIARQPGLKTRFTSQKKMRSKLRASAGKRTLRLNAVSG
jgi:hypothetical protein